MLVSPIAQIATQLVWLWHHTRPTFSGKTPIQHVSFFCSSFLSLFILLLLQTMIPQETDRRPSLYDNIPVLDLWYQTPIASPAASSPLPDRKTTCSSSRPVSEEGRRSVSFSTDPPSVHYIPDQVFDDELDTDSDRTHNHRRGNCLIDCFCRHNRIKNRLTHSEFPI